MSPDEEPNRGLCPTEENTWCRYNWLKIDGTHYSHKHSLPIPVLQAIKPIMRDLAYPDFIRRCLHGTTQSPNESFNSTVWSRLPKSKNYLCWI